MPRVRPALLLALLALSAQGPPAGAAPQAVGVEATPPKELTPGDLGGDWTNPFQPPVVSQGLGGGPNVFLYQLNLPHRRWKELFAVVRPDPNAGFPTPYPVLTLFHGYGERPESVLANTPLDEEAVARGWLVVVPLSAHIYSYGIDYSQDNVEDVFEFVQTLAPIDMDRVYAVGFSMGGGAALSYAARHQDPRHVRFAAVVNHTGSASLRDTFNAANVQAVFQSPLMFGAVPMRAPFRYQRSSVVDLKPGNLVDPETDMVRNLGHVPVLHYCAQNEPLTYLVSQSQAAHQRLLHWGGSSEWRVVPGSAHAWATVPATVLDDLDPLRLAPLASGTPVPVLADRNGRWHAFRLEQARDKQFSSFTAQWAPAQNELRLTALENLAYIGFDVDDPAMGLTTSSAFQLHLGARTADPVEVRIDGFATLPSAVDRNGVPGTNWTWDPQDSTLRLFEGDAVSGVDWTIRP